MLIRAIKLKQGKKYRKPKRAPITITSLKTIYTFLKNSTIPTHDKHMLWAASTPAFFGFLRSSEFVSNTTKSFNQETILLNTDITISSQYATVRIKQSKTDPFRQGCNIKLYPTYSTICPVQALQQYISHRTPITGPLFIYADGSNLTRRRLNKFLKLTLPIQIDSPFSSHSFRIGAATTAATGGLPHWMIQKLGRWNSDCYRTYIELSSQTINNAQRILATTISTGVTWDPDQ